jgi:hypothetical protein
MRGGGFKSFEKQRRGSYGKRNIRSCYSGDLRRRREVRQRLFRLCCFDIGLYCLSSIQHDAL